MVRMSGLARAVSRSWPRAAFITLFAVASATGCNSYDPAKLTGAAGTKADPGLDGGRAGASGFDADSGAAGSAGLGGMGGGAGAAGTGTTPEDCRPNPDMTDQVCPVICPETCNDIDDDCNLQIDDAAANDDCKLQNASSLCNHGACVIVECKGDFRDCDGKPENGCEAPRDDVNNCGTCGKKCSYVNGTGACVDDKCTAVACANGWDNCDNNTKDCETSTDQLDNCTACDTLCADVDHASPSCETGVCGPGECEAGFGDCDSAPENGCEEALTSNVDCGQCDEECAFPGSTPSCATGTCLAIGCDNDGVDFGECNGNTADGCESLNTGERCGSCTKKCNDTLDHVETATCTNKVCAIDTCESGWGNCDSGDTQTGCETPLDTLSNCGACGIDCDRDHAVPTCATGSCKIGECDDGFDDCNETDSDGCETSLNTNDDCGSCDTTCTGGRTCSGGSCSAVDCSMPPHNMADCGGTKCGNCDTSNDGDCETDLADDINNCGTCGNACVFNSGVTPNGTLACAAQSCVVTCAVGFGDCNGNYRDGCEQALNTLSNCNACGTSCAIANATATCTTFTGGAFKCEVATCNANFDDCNGDNTSCETALNTTSNCNTCGNSCNLPNAVDACTGSTGNWACTVASCDQTYYRNCNAMSGDGCEVDSRTNATNCGACNNNCTTHAQVIGASCAASACVYTCSSGFKDCGSSPGCETDVRTLTNCANCGVMCSRANATATCSTGSCAIATCNANFGKCDANDANGCESLRTLTDCGACGVPCAAPNGIASCSTGTCVKTGCNAGFDDCNGGLDCERNITAPGANETGGMGPCMPDTGCTLVRNPANNRDYYFCTTARTQAAARTQCQSQRFGDLVRIDDDAENTFVATNMAADAWIGAGDAATESAWRWSSNTLQFWSGAVSGTAIGGLYNKWNTGEPNDSSLAEDCAQILKAAPNTGKWNDLSCAGTLPFVCEIQVDACVSDTTKQHPMQCGCGVPDTDTDADGFANCVDGCPSDAAKSAPGQCGCGTADAFSDGDAAADCIDACPLDPLKSANTGQCGCGNADIDSDGDLVADCVDTCDYDITRSALPCSYSYPPSNFDPTSPTNIFTGAPNVVCSATATFDTNGTTAITFCGATITPVIRTQAGGPELWIIPMNAFTLNAGVTLRFTGGRPAVLAVANDAVIHGTIDVGAQLAVPGAGGNVSCAVGTGQGSDATHDADGDNGNGGGGGGGFGTVGAAAGGGDNGSGGGAGGAVSAIGTLVPLRGGCRGGANTAGGNVNGAGAGGGAIQLAIGGRLTVSGTGVIAAAGGGGTRGGAAEDGGGGGGSGGAIFLEAKHLSIDPNAWITSNGGGGAGGNATNSAAAGNGGNGGNASTARASGGGFDDAGGNDSDGGGGGLGAAFAGAATAGSVAGDRACALLIICGADGGGGGGGGGGVGRVRIHGLTAGGCTLTTTRQSPLASTACP